MKVKELLEKLKNKALVFVISDYKDSEEIIGEDDVITAYGEKKVKEFELDYSDIDELTLYIYVEGGLFD